MTDCTVLRNFVIYWNMVFKKSTDRKIMAKEASYLTLARFRCHWGNKKIGVFRKKCHFSFYCLNGNENASTVRLDQFIKQGLEGNLTKIGSPKLTDIDYNTAAPFICYFHQSIYFFQTHQNTLSH